MLRGGNDVASNRGGRQLNIPEPSDLTHFSAVHFATDHDRYDFRCCAGMGQMFNQRVEDSEVILSLNMRIPMRNILIELAIIQPNERRLNSTGTEVNQQGVMIHSNPDFSKAL